MSEVPLSHCSSMNEPHEFTIARCLCIFAPKRSTRFPNLSKNCEFIGAIGVIVVVNISISKTVDSNDPLVALIKSIRSHDEILTHDVWCHAKCGLIPIEVLHTLTHLDIVSLRYSVGVFIYEAHKFLHFCLQLQSLC